MDEQEIIAAVLAMHKPDAWKDVMVYSVWEDGEVTLEKGGDLFGCRTKHTVASGDEVCALPVAAMPMKTASGKHGRIFVGTNQEAFAARELILGDAA